MVVLIACDVLTTYAAKIVLGSRFAELGLIAGNLMKAFGNSWPFAMFLSEFVVFGATTYWYARGNRTLKLFGRNLPLAYLPTMALLALVANNSTVIFFFRAFMH